MSWPLVDPQDDGIRPAGRPDACFYCNRAVGEPHGPECVCVTKKVRVRYIFTLDLDVPAAWGRDQIEFHRNESSWCQNNAVNDLDQLLDALEPSCLCNTERFRCEFVDVVDATPVRKVRKVAH